MRQVADALHEPFKRAASNFVKQQGQDDRRRKTKQQVVHIQHDRVSDQLPGIRRVHEKIGKMLEADKLAAQDAAADRKILKRDDQPVHRHVFEKDVIQDAGQHQ